MFESLTDELQATYRVQWTQAKAASNGKVTCTCWKDIELCAAYRCLHCGLYFCRTCAIKHFGPDITDQDKAK